MQLVPRFFLFFALVFFQVFALQAETPDPVAQVNGQAISAQELEEQARATLSPMAQQIYEAKNKALNELIDQRLLAQEAKSRGISVEKLLEKEVDLPAKKTFGAMSEYHDKVTYEKVRAQYPDKSDREIKELIKGHLMRVNREKYYSGLIAQLRENADIKIFLNPPRVTEISTQKAPVSGNERAMITIVEFTDFQCPFCARAHDTMAKILEAYPGKVKLIQKQFPLGFHKEARPAALAALCAHEQKAYWNYTEYLWENQKSLDDEKLLDYAQKSGLNLSKFKNCFKNQKYASQIEADIKEGSDIGVSGTPAFFINGIQVNGARPFEYFKMVIDSELARISR